MAENNKASGGIGFCGLLAIVFITLRLVGVIGWPWLWVLAPIWIPVAVILVGILLWIISILLR
jgi:hypothetical protein